MLHLRSRNLHVPSQVDLKSTRIYIILLYNVYSPNRFLKFQWLIAVESLFLLKKINVSQAWRLRSLTSYLVIKRVEVQNLFLRVFVNTIRGPSLPNLSRADVQRLRRIIEPFFPPEEFNFMSRNRIFQSEKMCM